MSKGKLLSTLFTLSLIIISSTSHGHWKSDSKICKGFRNSLFFNFDISDYSPKITSPKDHIQEEARLSLAIYFNALVNQLPLLSGWPKGRVVFVRKMWIEKGKDIFVELSEHSSHSYRRDLLDVIETGSVAFKANSSLRYTSLSSVKQRFRNLESYKEFVKFTPPRADFKALQELTAGMPIPQNNQDIRNLKEKLNLAMARFLLSQGKNVQLGFPMGQTLKVEGLVESPNPGESIILVSQLSEPGRAVPRQLKNVGRYHFWFKSDR